VPLHTHTFDFDDPANRYLYFRRRGPVFWIVTVGLIFGFLIYTASHYIDPAWVPPNGRGKSSGLLVPLALLPIPLRALVFVAVLAVTAEALYRGFDRMYNGRPAVIIGPTGVARIDPWKPRAFGWDQVREIRRVILTRGNRRRPLAVGFEILGPRARPPRWMPVWLWSLMPERVREPRIALSPGPYDYTEEEFATLIRHFAGPVTFHSDVHQMP